MQNIFKFNNKRHQNDVPLLLVLVVQYGAATFQSRLSKFLPKKFLIIFFLKILLWKKLFLYFRKQSFLKFSQKKTFHIFLEMEASKNLYFREWNFPVPGLKNFLCFTKWNFLALIFKNFLHCLKRLLFLYFRKQKQPNFRIFQETETLKNFFLTQKMKRTHSTLKMFLIFFMFQEGTSKAWKSKISYVSFQP